MSLIEGTAIGPYRIVRKIGEGGMGAVYLAHHALLGRPAAIKMLLPALSSQREVVDRFFNEARATTAVSDPGIVQVFDFGFHGDGSAYIVMELLDGESLATRLERGPLALGDALRITRQVAGSLAAAHARGIVHRDLKPDNLFIVRDGEAQGGERPKILDFGIAKLTNDASDRSRTRTGTVMGTPIYMSPEQCRGAGIVDHRADIYSLGCVLYHLITGRPPFDLEGMGEIISAHLREPPRAPSAWIPGIPRAVDDLVLRCLAKAPDERFASMGELQAACEAQLARITGAGALTIALPVPLASGSPTTLGHAAGEAVRAPSRRGIAMLALAAVVALVAAGALVATRGGDEPAARAAAPTLRDARVPPDAPAPADASAPIDASVPIDASAPPAAKPDAHAPPPRHHVPANRPAAPQGDLYDVR